MVNRRLFPIDNQTGINSKRKNKNMKNMKHLLIAAMLTLAACSVSAELTLDYNLLFENHAAPAAADFPYIGVADDGATYGRNLFIAASPTLVAAATNSSYVAVSAEEDLSFSGNLWLGVQPGDEIQFHTDNSLTPTTTFDGSTWDFKGSALTNYTIASDVFANGATVSFAAETAKAIDVGLSAPLIDILRGRLSAGSGSSDPTSLDATLTIYTDTGTLGSDALYRATIKIVLVGLSAGAASGQKDVAVDDASSYAVNDLVEIWESAGTKEFARIESIAANTLTMQDNLIETYTSAAKTIRQGEYGGFGYGASASTLFAEVSFASAQTLSVKNWIEYK